MGPPYVTIVIPLLICGDPAVDLLGLHANLGCLVLSHSTTVIDKLPE